LGIDLKQVVYQHSRLTDKLKRSTGSTGKCVTLNLLAIGLCRRALAPSILGVGDRLGISCDPSSPHSCTLDPARIKELSSFKQANISGIILCTAKICTN
jgi:hypothetical protein